MFYQVITRVLSIRDDEVTIECSNDVQPEKTKKITQ